jgi:hypothetical protein
MVLRGAVYPVHWMRLMMWNGSEEVGDVGRECEEVEGTDTMTLIGKVNRI